MHLRLTQLTSRATDSYIHYFAILLLKRDYKSHVTPVRKKSILKKENFNENFNILNLSIFTEDQSPSENLRQRRTVGNHSPREIIRVDPGYKSTAFKKIKRN